MVIWLFVTTTFGPLPPENLFPRIIGNSEEQFHRHIQMLKTRYQMISLQDAFHFSQNGLSFNGRVGMLITFDDGLSDHYHAAKILAEYGIKATFFIPTCILIDKEPANPTIIHYVIAHYGIQGFVSHFHGAVETLKLDKAKLKLNYCRGKDDPWKKISEIKKILNTA